MYISCQAGNCRMENDMTTYVEVAQALVSAGYLSDADLEAAAEVLKDALIIDAAEAVQDDVAEDYSTQEDIVAEAEVWESEDAATGDYDLMEEDQEVIEDALDQEEVDKEIMVEAEEEIAAAYLDAAAALLAAELIDEADQQAVAVLVADVWASYDEGE
ncbi:MAG: hypothetical protein ACK2U3_15805 [Anaerolineales bacterium]